jgi:hypothetical protein
LIRPGLKLLLVFNVGYLHRDVKKLFIGSEEPFRPFTEVTLWLLPRGGPLPNAGLKHEAKGTKAACSKKWAAAFRHFCCMDDVSAEESDKHSALLEHPHVL